MKRAWWLVAMLTACGSHAPPPAPHIDPPHPEAPAPPDAPIAAAHLVAPRDVVVVLDVGDEAFSEALRGEAKATVNLSPHRAQTIDEYVLTSCDPGPACLASIGKALGADWIVGGMTNAASGGLRVDLLLVSTHDPAKHAETSLTYAPPDVEHAAHRAWETLTTAQ